jgi:hypothetical protein
MFATDFYGDERFERIDIEPLMSFNVMNVTNRSFQLSAVEKAADA